MVMMMVVMMIVTVVPELFALKSRKGCQDTTPLVLDQGTNWRFGVSNPRDKSLLLFG
jgi:hypothetical protein